MTRGFRKISKRIGISKILHSGFVSRIQLGDNCLLAASGSWLDLGWCNRCCLVCLHAEDFIQIVVLSNQLILKFYGVSISESMDSMWSGAGMATVKWRHTSLEPVAALILLSFKILHLFWNFGSFFFHYASIMFNILILWSWPLGHWCQLYAKPAAKKTKLYTERPHV